MQQSIQQSINYGQKRHLEPTKKKVIEAERNIQPNKNQVERYDKRKTSPGGKMKRCKFKRLNLKVHRRMKGCKFKFKGFYLHMQLKMTKNQDAVEQGAIKKKKKRTARGKIFKSRPQRGITRVKKRGIQLQSKLGGCCGARMRHVGMSKSWNLYLSLIHI